MGSDLSGEDGNSRVLCADANTHEEARDEQTLPVGREARRDWGRRETDTGDKNLSATAEPVVERIDDESATATQLAETPLDM